MKLQIKYNFIDLDQAIAIAHATKEFCDIFEVGQLLLLHYGIQAVERFCKEFPDKKIYVDAKLSERPEESIDLFAGLGVHYVSILAGTYHTIIKKVCEFGTARNINIIIDFINATSLGQSAMDAKTLGATGILIHREGSFDESDDSLTNDWQQVRDNTDLPIFIQGKINLNNIKSIIALRPQVIVIGDAITRSKQPATEAEAIKKLIQAVIVHGPRL